MSNPPPIRQVSFLWYYAKRGDWRRRGVVEEDALYEMARTGQLAPDDLVWSRTVGGRWVAASRITGLFAPLPSAEPEPEPGPAPGGAKAKRRPPALVWDPEPMQRLLRTHRAALFAMTLLALALAAAVVLRILGVF